MGNRASIYSVSRDKTDNFMLFEANNNLPFFWILLLDSKTIMQNKDELIRSFYEDEEWQSIKLSNETLAKNINTSTRYLERYSAELLSKFREFGDYILKISKENFIEIDLLDIANFTSVEEFVDKLVFYLKKVENQERLDELLTLNKADFLELVGYDDMGYLPKSFSKFSNKYGALREEIQKKYELEKQQRKRREEKEKRYYYTMLIILFSIGAYQIATFEFIENNVWYFLKSIWAVLLFIFLFWSKKELIGNSWFSKQQTPYKPSYTLQDNISKNKDFTELSKTEEQAYIELEKLCCSVGIQNKVILFLSNLQHIKNEYDYDTLIKNYNGLRIDFPKYNDNVFLDVLEEFNNALKKHGLQIGLMDTQSDEYVFIVHKVTDKEKPSQLFNDIGYLYFGNLEREEKEKRKERNRRFFSDILFMGIIGLVFFAGGIAIIIKEGISFLAVTGIIMGLLSMLYSYFKFKNII